MIKKSKISSHIILICAFVAIATSLNSQDLRINEIQSSNTSTISDEFGKFPDWIEIYNSGNTTVNLSGWSLTDNSGNLRKWNFPDKDIAAGAYLLVFASGKDLIGDTLHTNFSIDKDGEYLALVNNTGNIVSAFDPVPPLLSDYSLCYESGTYVISTQPTPGSLNSFSEPVILPTPVFSKQPGYYDQSFFLELSSELPDVEIYYTLNGDDPSANSTKYTTPILVDKTTLVRALAVRLFDKSASMTNSYIFLDDVINQPNDPNGFPAMWGPYEAIPGNAIGDYEMDPEITQDPKYKDQMIASLKSLPVISMVTKKDNLFLDKIDDVTGGIYMYPGAPDKEIGKGWERPASIEYFDKEGNREFQINCGIRIHGQHSRRPEKTPKHSFRVSFKTEYGPSKLKHDIFGDSATKTFNSILLKTSFGNSATHHSHSQRIRSQWARDQWAKDTQLAMGNISSHTKPVHLYIDGLYWGIYFLAERPNEDFLESYMGGSPDDYDVIRDYTEVDAGTIDAWNEMMAQVRGDMTNNANYYRVLGKNPDGTDNPDYPPYIDAENLIDYMMINMYGGNSDWDHKNWVSAYKRTGNRGGFKFLCWDTEMILNGYNDNVTGENNQNCPSEIFQRLMVNNEFKTVFESRIKKHMTNGGALTPEGAGGRFEALVKNLELAVIAEYARWGDYRRDVHNYSGGPYEFYTPETFEAQRAFLRDEYFPRRTDILLSQFESKGFLPEVETPILLQNDTQVTNSTVLVAGTDSFSFDSSSEVYFSTSGNDPQNAGTVEYSLEGVVSLGDEWKYIEDISDYPANWNNVTFDDAGWSQGATQIGYGDGDEATTISFGSSSSSKIPTYLFRKSITIDDLTNVIGINLGLIADDGGIVYLNGEEIYRFNMNSGNIVFNNYAAGTVQNENTAVYANLAKDQLVTGLNVIACEIHQASGTSSDMSFDLSFELMKEQGNGESDVQIYQSDFSLTKSGTLKARAFKNDQWSGLLNKRVILLQDRSGLKITEINYNPTGEGDTDGRYYEFIELANTGSTAIDLGGVKFSKGVNYTFPLGLQLAAGEYLVIVSDEASFESRYGFAPLGRFVGQLDNAGEELEIVDYEGNVILNMTFDDEKPWPTKADGDGYTLELFDEMSGTDPSIIENWGASGKVNGSPGKKNDPSETIIIAGADENTKPVSIYPNPVSELLIIDAAGKVDNLQVLDLSGRKIDLAQVTKVRNNQTILDVASLRSGVYFLNITISESTYKKRFVVK